MSFSRALALDKFLSVCRRAHDGTFDDVFNNHLTIDVEWITEADEFVLRSNTAFKFSYTVQNVHTEQGQEVIYRKCIIVDFNNTAKFAIAIEQDITDRRELYMSYVATDYDCQLVDFRVYLQSILESIEDRNEEEWLRYLSDYTRVLEDSKTGYEYDDSDNLSVVYVLNKILEYNEHYFNAIRNYYGRIKRSASLRMAQEVDHFGGYFLEVLTKFTNEEQLPSTNQCSPEEARMIMIAGNYCDIVMKAALNKY